MFDEAFFDKEFVETAQAFVRDQGGLGVAVEVVTLAGERLDVLDIATVRGGTRLVTRDERLVFLPYAQIAHVDVSSLRDKRRALFQLRTSAE